MKTYRIPKTDLDVPQMAYGTWHLGGDWDDSPLTDDLKQRADTLIHTAVDAGINFIDLADIYVKTKSDEAVGHVLKNDPSLRDKVILQEKAGIILPDDPNPGDPGRYDFSYENITTKLENSLRLLNTDHVELLLLHRPDALVEPEEVARAFDDLQSAGKVRYFGVSNHTPMQIELLQKYIDQPLVVNQLELNLLHNDLIFDGITANTADHPYTGARGTLDYCRANDMLVQAWSPVARGVLFNPADDAPENVKQTAQRVRELAETHNTTPGAIVLAWLLRHPAGIQPILGTMTPHRIPESAAAVNVELSRLEWYKLAQTANGAGVP